MLGLSFAILLGLVLPFSAIAADKPKKPAKMSNLQGKVQMMSKDNSTITVEQRGGLRRVVMYSGDTKFMYGHRLLLPGEWMGTARRMGRAQ